MRKLRFDSPLLDDAPFYLKTLYCSTCNDKVDFYLEDSEPFCECCNSELDMTIADVLSVIGRGKRDPILRLRSRIFHKNDSI